MRKRLYCRQMMNIQLKRKILQTDNEYIVKEEGTADKIMNINLNKKILRTDNEYVVKVEEEDTANR